jgi:hypothetical protein
VRCSVETTFKNVAAFFSMMMLVSWFYTRLFVLPQIIWRCYTDPIYDTTEFKANPCLVGQLCILQILHVYWFIVLIKSIVKYATKGKIKDYQNTIEANKKKN